MNTIPHYNLVDKKESDEKSGYFSRILASAKEFGAFIGPDKARLIYAFIFIVLNSSAGIFTPYFISIAIDQYISTRNIAGLLHIILILFGFYILTAVSGYFQSLIMGRVAQRTLFRLRNGIFDKLQALPIAFFSQNKAGDLMSRINNDTDKLSEFLSESIVRFIGSAFVIFGIGIFIFFLNWKLALVLLSATVLIFIISQLVSPWVEKQNAASLKALGLFSSNVQENISNFKVIVAFNRRNYFTSSIKERNKQNFNLAVLAGYANNIYSPIYDFAGNIAQVAVLVFGIYLIIHGQLEIGLLIGFLSYTQKFYDPLRMLASIFGNVQVSVAAWSRIRDILNLENNITTLAGESETNKSSALLEFKDVSFNYDESTKVLWDINLVFEEGKTYALVGPTGGGKSTTASLMDRLYDPSSGTIFFNGRDMRSYSRLELGKSIGVILQEPFLFSGTVGENIRYGNASLTETTDEKLAELLEEKGLHALLSRFEKGLATEVDDSAENISLGQKQLISFIRAILREPELLILDEATANIDTVTEELLNNIIAKLPKKTTKVVIAHRLNTIREADEIIFINSGKAEIAGSYDHALEMINSSKRQS
jgi:ATP-binding cassette subfamily B protein